MKKSVRKTERPSNSRPSKSIGTAKNEDEGKDQYFSRAVSKALEVLELLQVSSSPLALNEIASKIKLSKTSAFRLLKTLEVSGYIALDGRGQYRLAPGARAITPAYLVDKTVRLGQPVLYALSCELSETATLAMLFSNRIEVIAVVESPQVIRMSNVVGHILPPNASSLGKLITAFQSDEQRGHLLRSFKIYRFTEHTITDQKQLNREYEAIRSQSYAVDREECDIGGVCFSVPVLGAAGTVSLAISVSMPKVRIRDARHEADIVAALRSAADQLAKSLAEG